MENLWMFVKDKYFMCIHLMYDEKRLVRGFEPTSKEGIEDQINQFVLKSDICIGFLPKKGNASVKSMLKAYHLEDHYDKHMSSSSSHLQRLINCPQAQISGINTTAYLSRLELYVDEH